MSYDSLNETKPLLSITEETGEEARDGIQNNNNNNNNDNIDDKILEFNNIDDVLIYSTQFQTIPKFQLLVFISSGLMFMSDAMEITLLSFLYSCLKSYWNLSSEQALNMISCIFFGELVGSIFSGIGNLVSLFLFE